MSRFNHYYATHFQGSGCRLIARAYDDCRNRNVQLFALPGEYEIVGVSDGTDCWIAPAAAAPFFRTATGNVAEIMRALKLGEPLPPIPDAPKRKGRVVLDDDEPAPRPTKRARASLDEIEEPQPRRARREDLI